MHSAFFNRFQLEIIDFSCGSRSRGQNKDARAEESTLKLHEAPENLSVPWATYCIR
jgi:hypothetical protein